MLNINVSDSGARYQVVKDEINRLLGKWLDYQEKIIIAARNAGVNTMEYAETMTEVIRSDKALYPLRKRIRKIFNDNRDHVMLNRFSRLMRAYWDAICKHHSLFPQDGLSKQERAYLKRSQ